MGTALTAAVARRGRSHAASLLAAGATRVVLFLAVGGVAFLLIELSQLVGEAVGLCTRCNVGSDGPLLWSAAAGGGAAATAGSDDIFGEDYFDNLLDRIFGNEPPEPSIEGAPLPTDPAFDGPADVDAIRSSGIYEEIIDDDSTLNQLARSARRLFGADVAEPPPETPLPEPPLLDPPSGRTRP